MLGRLFRFGALVHRLLDGGRPDGRRAHVAALVVADLTGDFSQQGQLLFDHRRVLDRHVAGQRADAQLVPVFLDVVEVLQAVDVDDCRRLRESEPHQRNQAVPTGEHLCVLSIFAEQLGRLLHRGGTCVFECGWNHLLAPFIMCQSLSGVAGMSTCLMPSGLSASQMALITAALAAMVPASPIPLTPKELVGEGVTVWSRLSGGISPIPGSRESIIVPVLSW